MKRTLLLLAILSFLITISAKDHRITTSFQTEKILPNDIFHITYITNSYMNTSEVFHGYYTYPRFPDNVISHQELNAFYIQHFAKQYEQIKEVRDSAFESILTPKTVFAYDHTFEVTLYSQDFLSILENTVVFAGGASPDISYEAHSFSLENGRSLSLQDLFHAPAENIETRIKYVLIKKIQQSPDNFYPDAPNTINLMTLDEFKFYLTPDRIIIFFNPGEVAPYAGGIIKFALHPTAFENQT